MWLRSVLKTMCADKVSCSCSSASGFVRRFVPCSFLPNFTFPCCFFSLCALTSLVYFLFLSIFYTHGSYLSFYFFLFTLLSSSFFPSLWFSLFVSFSPPFFFPSVSCSSSFLPFPRSHPFPSFF